MTYNLFGIIFEDGNNYKQIYKRLINKEFMVVPSGPGLSTIDYDKKYYEALKSADFAIPDSSAMVILALIFYNYKINKLSGPRFLRKFIKEDILRQEGNIFSIDPSIEESKANREYLNSINIPITPNYQYVAPCYIKEDIKDSKLLNNLEILHKKPKFILLNIAGGKQERLGYYLKKNLSYKVAIICTGAAIAFQTGKQVKLPNWIDKYYLGWLVRSLQNPRKYGMRFVKAVRIIYVFYLWRKRR